MKICKIIRDCLSKKIKNYLIFKWHNIDEAKDILQDTINLTLINLEKSIYEELEFS